MMRSFCCRWPVEISSAIKDRPLIDDLTRSGCGSFRPCVMVFIQQPAIIISTRLFGTTVWRRHFGDDTLATTLWRRQFGDDTLEQGENVQQRLVCGWAR